MSNFDNCLNFLKYVFNAFFSFLSNVIPFGNISLLSFFIGTFLVFLIVDNFVLKGK